MTQASPNVRQIPRCASWLNMIKSLDNIIRSTDKDFTEAWRLVSIIDRIHTIRMHSDADDHDHELDESEYEHDESLKFIMGRIRIRVVAILEILALRTLLAEFEQVWVQHSKKPTHMEFAPQIGELYCPGLECLNSYYLVIKELTGEASDIEAHIAAHELTRLTSILRATPKIIFDRRVMPSNEADVRKHIYEVLTAIFPDTVRELPLPSVVKIYKPDIGIRQIKALIEYKYSTDENDLKQAIDGIMADIPAYSDHPPWEHFFAVFYITSPFYTEDQIISHFDKKMIRNWHFLVVQGQGQRKKRDTKTVKARATK